MLTTDRPVEKKQLSRSRLWVFRVIAVVIAIVAALVVVEIGARMMLAARPNDIEALRQFERKRSSGQKMTLIHFVRASNNPRLIFELIPGIEGNFHGADVRINKAGYFDEDRTLEKPPGTFRIAAIGDSVLFGWGAPMAARYSNILEQFLNDTATTGTRFEVLNFGVPGYNTVIEAESLKSRALAYDPDAVLVGFVLDNDAALPNFLSAPPKLWTLRKSFALDLLRSRGLAGVREEVGPGLRGADPKHVPPEYQHLSGWDKAHGALREIGKIAGERRMPAIFMLDHYNVEKWRAPESLPLTDDTTGTLELYACARNAGHIVVNPAPEMVRFLDRHGYHSYALCVAPSTGDAHPNAIRHAIIARCIYERMVEADALPDAAVRRQSLPDDLARWDRLIEEARQSTSMDPKYMTRNAE